MPGTRDLRRRIKSVTGTAQITRAMLEFRASEESARMVAMKNATDNATGLIKDLTLAYNHLRQGNVTKELLEIAGGQQDND